MPDLSSIPVVGILLSTALDNAHFNAGFLPNTTTLACLGAGVKFSLDSADLAILSLSAIEVEMTFHNENDPFGYGYEQTIFNFSCRLADNTFQVDVDYDSHAALLTASPTRIAPCTVDDILQQLLPSGIVNVLSPLIGSMTLDSVSIQFSLDGKSITSFSVVLGSDQSLSVGSLALQSLEILYTGATETPTKTHASLQVQGVLTANNSAAVFLISCIADSQPSSGLSLSAPSLASSLTVSMSITPQVAGQLCLTDFITLMQIQPPTYDTPAGCPVFDSLQITGISGT